jgi:hypothetical protein
MQTLKALIDKWLEFWIVSNEEVINGSHERTSLIPTWHDRDGFRPRLVNYIDDAAIHSGDHTDNARETSFGDLDEWDQHIIIDKQGLRPNEKKVKAIQTICSPKNPHDIKVFMGLINYYRGFIPKCSDLAAPINQLLQKGVEFHWTPTHEECFVRLKEALAQDCLRNHFDSSRECELYTDCSDYAMAAVLSQKTD